MTRKRQEKDKKRTSLEHDKNTTKTNRIQEHDKKTTRKRQEKDKTRT